MSWVLVAPVAVLAAVVAARRPGRGAVRPAGRGRGHRVARGAGHCHPGLPPGRPAGEHHGAGRVGVGRVAAGGAATGGMGVARPRPRRGSGWVHGGSTSGRCTGRARLGRGARPGGARPAHQHRRRARSGRAADRAGIRGHPDRRCLHAGAVAGIDWLVLALLGLVVVVALVIAPARDRLALVLALSVVGFALAAVYALVGAPDVALVAVVVETMLTLVFLAALARLPDERPDRDRDAAVRARNRRRDVVAGAVAGLAVFASVWGFLSQPAASTVASRARPAHPGGARRRRGHGDRRRLPRPGHAGRDHGAARRRSSGWSRCCGGAGCGEPGERKAGRGRRGPGRRADVARPGARWSRPR